MTDQFLAETYYHLIHTLRGALPSRPTDTAEDLAKRDEAAIARIGALNPANAVEADQAALHIAAFEQWKECLRLAEQFEAGSRWAEKCIAQANAMLRNSQSSLQLLLRLQAARQKIEADPVARERAARDRETALRLMTEALKPQPARTAVAEPSPPAAPEPQPKPEQVVWQPHPDPLAADEEPAPRKWLH